GIRDFHVTGVQTCALPILAIGPRIPENAGTRAPRGSHFACHGGWSAHSPTGVIAMIRPALATALFAVLLASGCGDKDAAPQPAEIGRASCREREGGRAGAR